MRLPFFSSESSDEPERLAMKVRFSPIRLSAYSGERVDIVILLENRGGRKALLSLDVEVPKSTFVGFDQAGLQKKVNVRCGELAPGQVVEKRVSLYSTRATRPGEIPVDVVLCVHSDDYNKVLYSYKKRASLRCV